MVDGDGDERAASSDDLSGDMIVGAAPGRRRSHAFELFILGELLDGPHHGYLLRDILQRLLGPYRQISWAAIYPLIRKLAHDGCIVELTDEELRQQGVTSDKRQPRFYRLTEIGRQRFSALMLAPAAHTADYREIFTIKLLYLHVLTLAQQRDIFVDAQVFSEKEYQQRQRVFTKQSPSARLPSTQRERVFRVVRFQLASIEGELAWVNNELARLDHIGTALDETDVSL